MDRSPIDRVAAGCRGEPCIHIRRGRWTQYLILLLIAAIIGYGWIYVQHSLYITVAMLVTLTLALLSLKSLGATRRFYGFDVHYRTDERELRIRHQARSYLVTGLIVGLPVGGVVTALNDQPDAAMALLCVQGYLLASEVLITGFLRGRS